MRRRTRSRALARRHTGLAYANPMRKGAISTALVWLGASAVAGAVIGGVASATNLTSANLTTGMIGGAASVTALTSLGGLVVGLASPSNRNAGFATAGLGLAALVVTNLVTSATLSSSVATKA
jgi:hypothetical protein